MSRGWCRILATQIGEPVKKQNVTNLTKPEVPCARAKKVIPSRSPLPKRVNRVVDPAKPDMPQAKRTLAVVAAAEAKKSKLLRRLEELDKQNKLTLAEMELNEEDEEASVVTGLARQFRVLLNKIAKNMKIFMEVDLLKGYLEPSQH